MFSPYVWTDVGLVVSKHSWYATDWQAVLTVGFRVSTCSRTNTDSVLYLFLTCTRPPDSTRNKYTEDIAQERSQSQSQNVCNELVISSPLHLIIYGHPWAEHNIEEVCLSSTSNINHFVRVTCTGVIGLSSSKYSDYCSRTHLLVWFILLVQSEFWFLRYFPVTWGCTSTRLLHLPRTASSSSRSTIYISQGHRRYVMWIFLV